ncbi:hypothetical protein MMEU_3714 [Mycobacterium marinum str. Europe]|nr:hypothetical protein MMEU_3714 [Mycobacterium marinum str. Europe]
MIARGHDSVVFELDQRLLDGDPADPEAPCDLVAVDTVAAS